MKSFKYKLLVFLLTISFFLNLSQCSNSNYHNDDIEALDYDIIELESELMHKQKKISQLNKIIEKKDSIIKSSREIKVVPKKFKKQVIDSSAINIPHPIDSNNLK